MKNFFAKIKVLFTYGDELQEIVEFRRRQKESAEREAKRNRLQLCYAHQPIDPGAHYAPHNCDHCKVLAQLEKEE